MALAEHAPAAAAVTPLPPQNLDAEESILGAILLSPHAIDNVAQLVDAGDFYRESHARIYRAALSLHKLGFPVDAITVADRLAATGELEQAGGKERVHELAALVPATSNAAHWARIVHDMATLRGLTAAGERIQRLGWERPGDTAQLVQEARSYLDELAASRVGASIPLDGGLRHDQVLDLQLPADRYLIEDLVPAGAVGTIAAVPESHKSWLAQAIAIRVGRGAGWILGKQVCARGRVGYVWQDDSTAEEAERVKAFEQVHPTGQDATTDVIWWLNAGVQLPRDIPRLRATVEQQQLALLVLDSYYNFLPGVDLKDEQAEQIVSLLKREISDATGCTVLIVDHMPWATDTNRQRLRAYGGVFKNAATRFGIYIDAAGEKLHLEARGNNIRGIPRTLAYWEANTLELKLISKEEADHDTLLSARAEAVLEWLRDHTGSHTQTEIRDAVHGKGALTDEALEELLAAGKISDHGRDGRAWSGKRGAARYWTADPLPEQPVEPGTLWDEVGRSDAQPQQQSEKTSSQERDEVGRGSATLDQTLNNVPASGRSAPQPRSQSQTARDDVGTSFHETTSRATQNNLVPPPTEAPPFRGASSAGRGLDADPTEPRPERRDVVAEATAWIEHHGAAHPDPADHLLEHYPTLGSHDLGRLLKRASELAASTVDDDFGDDTADDFGDDE